MTTVLRTEVDYHGNADHDNEVAIIILRLKGMPTALTNTAAHSGCYRNAIPFEIQTCRNACGDDEYILFFTVHMQINWSYDDAVDSLLGAELVRQIQGMFLDNPRADYELPLEAGQVILNRLMANSTFN